jgi:hypothetical protein
VKQPEYQFFMTGRLGVGGSNPLAPTKISLIKKGFLNIGRLDGDPEMRTYRRRYAGSRAKSPEIVPKYVLRMFASDKGGAHDASA